MSLKDDIQRFAHELEAADNAASDLWTWLPSYKAAERAHGDYASEYQPDHATVMKEAAMLFAELKGFDHSDAEIEEWFGCPCQECEEVEGKRPPDLVEFRERLKK
jgi:hypothetical protein